MLIAAGATREWRAPLLLFVPVFFVAALASRASTVWTSGGAGELDERVRAAWIRRALLATGALVAAMAAAVVLSFEGGVFDRIGMWLTPAANAVATFFAWVLSQAARPIFWLVDRLGIDPDRVREFLESLREGSARRAFEQQGAGEPSIWQRMLGFLVFAAIAYAVVRAIRHFRPPVGAEPEPRAPGTQTESPISVVETVPARSLFRRELPADAVRRWYAETLLALESSGSSASRGRRRRSSRRWWPRPFPSCAAEFELLTRAYEDVRYGSLRLDRPALRDLESGQKRIAATLRGG